MLANNSNGLRMEIITEPWFPEVIQHLRQTFFADEPLNKAVSLCRPGDGHTLLEKHSLSSLRDGISVMAVTNSGEVSVRLVIIPLVPTRRRVVSLFLLDGGGVTVWCGAMQGMSVIFSHFSPQFNPR